MKESMYPSAGGKRSISDINPVTTSDGIAAASNRTVLRNKQEIVYNEQAMESNSDDADKTALQTDHIPISVVHHNFMETRLERAERLNVSYFEFSGEFWKSKCSRLNKELSNAIVSKKCKRACSSNAQTTSASAPQNEFTSNKLNFATVTRILVS